MTRPRYIIDLRLKYNNIFKRHVQLFNEQFSFLPRDNDIIDDFVLLCILNSAYFREVVRRAFNN